MTFEETYLLRSGYDGRDVGIIKITTTAIREGAQIATELTLSAIGDAPVPSGDYSLDFIKIDRDPRPRPASRFAQLRPANEQGALL